MSVVASRRGELQSRLFPSGIPKLWCPAITHFSAARTPDPLRTAAHLKHLAPYVRGLLIPGSTGEGWDMNDRDIQCLLDLVLDIAHNHHMAVLIGILKTQVDQVLDSLRQLKTQLQHPAFVGITVCPTKGEQLSSADIARDLKTVLDQGYPTAVYQLPQVTQNEISCEVMAELISIYENLILFKDTSGQDRIAVSGLDHAGVFFVRGSEQGGYARWLKSAGGPYDGYLLSTANTLAAPLHQVIASVDGGNQAAASELSNQLQQAVQQVFDVAATIPNGNAFSNANKLMDHFFAWGSQAESHPAPLLLGGTRLPVEALQQTRAILLNLGLLPERGYLQV